MRVLAENVAVVLLLFFLSLYGAATMAEIKSPMVGTANRDLSCPPPQSSHDKTCPLSSEDHYSVQLTQLSLIYFLFAIINLIYFRYWNSLYLKIRPCFRRVHCLLGRLLIIKSLSLICAAVDKYHEKVVHHRSDLLFHILTFVGVFRLLIAIQLIVNGWQLVKPFLQRIDKFALLILIPLMVLGNVLSIVIGETGNVRILSKIIWLVDLICPCVLLFTHVWKIILFVMDGTISSRLEGVRSVYTMVTTYSISVTIYTQVKNEGHVQRWYLLMMEIMGVLFYWGLCKLFNLYCEAVD